MEIIQDPICICVGSQPSSHYLPKISRILSAFDKLLSDLTKTEARNLSNDKKGPDDLLEGSHQWY